MRPRTRASRLGIAVVYAAALACAGCPSPSLPAGPSDLATGVVIFEHANFSGRSAHVASDIRDLKDFQGPCEHDRSTGTGTTTFFDWNDCISSVRVAPGWRVTIYRDDGFDGQSHESGTDLPNLQLVTGSCDHDGLNDCVSSIRVRQQ